MPSCLLGPRTAVPRASRAWSRASLHMSACASLRAVCWAFGARCSFLGLTSCLQEQHCMLGCVCSLTAVPQRCSRSTAVHCAVQSAARCSVSSIAGCEQAGGCAAHCRTDCSAAGSVLPAAVCIATTKLCWAGAASVQPCAAVGCPECCS